MKKKTAVITGASRGIGLATAIEFARTGYDIAMFCLTSKELLNQLAAQLEADYSAKVLTFVGDLGNYDFVAASFTEILAQFGSIDVLINNAGISQIGLLQDLTPAEWRTICATNLDSVFYCCKQIIPSMVAARKGCIINLSSIWGQAGASCEVAYSATKGAVDSFTKALAKELAPSNIRVNALSCGVIETEMNQFLSSRERAELMDEIPAGRFGSAQEVAALALQIAHSPAYLTGQIIRMDGGLL